MNTIFDNDIGVVNKINNIKSLIEEYDLSKQDHHINSKTMRKNISYSRKAPVLMIKRPYSYQFSNLNEIQKRNIKYYTDIDDDLALILSEHKVYSNNGEFSLKNGQDEIIELLEKNSAKKTTSIRYDGSKITSYYIKPNIVYEEYPLDTYKSCSESTDNLITIFKGKTYDTNYIYSQMLTKICPVYIPCPDGYVSIGTKLQCTNKTTFNLGYGINHGRQMFGQAIKVENGSEIIISLNETKPFTHIGTVGSYPSVNILNRYSMLLPNGKIRLSKKKRTNIMIKDEDYPTSWCKEYNLYYRNEINKKYIILGKFNSNVCDHDFKLNDLRQHLQFVGVPIKYLKLVPIMEPDCLEINMAIGLYNLTTKSASVDDVMYKIDTSNPAYFVKYDIISPDTKYVYDKPQKSYECKCSKCTGAESKKHTKRIIRSMIKKIMEESDNDDIDYSDSDTETDLSIPKRNYTYA
jgi:hypothetical protein